MKRILTFLLSVFSRRVMVVDVRRFGERLAWSEVQTAFRSQQGGTLFRAMGQILACQREINHLAVEDKSNLPAAQTAYEAGAAACAADVMALLLELETGTCQDGRLKAYFAQGKMTKPE